ncbi:MAG: PAS domain S-box protein, partial [Proteobacteria bacterium]|nr:PAS domain S-box protein [Pseudomonadota bacterium]
MKHDSLARDFSSNPESPQVGYAGENGAQGASTQLLDPRHTVESSARKVNNIEIDHEEFRLRELARYRILDTLPEQAYDDIVALAAHICDAPIALISLVDDHRQWFKSKHGIDTSETDRAHAFCAHAIAQPDTLVVHDPLNDPRFATNPLVVGALGIRFYAGAQLITRSGAALGTLCVIDQAPRAFTAEQQLALETLARQVMTHLELRLQAMEFKATIAEGDQQRLLLQASEQRLELTLEASQAGIWDWDIKNKTVIFSDRWKALLGYAPHEIGNDESEWSIRIHPVDQDLVSSWLRDEFTRPGIPAHCEYRMLHKDGRVIWVSVRAIAVHDDNGNPYRAVGSALDVSDRRRIDEELYQAKERAEITLQSIGDAVITTDIDGIIESLNPVAERLIGYGSAEALGRGFESVFRIVNEKTREPIENPLAACLRTGMIVALDSPTVLIRPDGSELSIDDSAAPIRTADGEVIGAVLVFRDVSEERRLAESVSHQATHDTLTDLVNRREFERRLELMLKSSVEQDVEHGLCYIDLDQFKVINDTCGHAAGDALLTQLSNMLKTKVRQRDT